MCEKEISHMGKNNGNPDLVARKDINLWKSQPEVHVNVIVEQKW